MDGRDSSAPKFTGPGFEATIGHAIQALGLTGASSQIYEPTTLTLATPDREARWRFKQACREHNEKPGLLTFQRVQQTWEAHPDRATHPDFWYGLPEDSQDPELQTLMNDYRSEILGLSEVDFVVAPTQNDPRSWLQNVTTRARIACWRSHTLSPPLSGRDLFNIMSSGALVETTIPNWNPAEQIRHLPHVNKTNKLRFLSRLSEKLDDNPVALVPILIYNGVAAEFPLADDKGLARDAPRAVFLHWPEEDVLNFQSNVLRAMAGVLDQAGIR